MAPDEGVPIWDPITGLSRESYLILSSALARTIDTTGGLMDRILKADLLDLSQMVDEQLDHRGGIIRDAVQVIETNEAMIEAQRDLLLRTCRQMILEFQQLKDLLSQELLTRADSERSERP